MYGLMGIEVVDIIIIGKHAVFPSDDARHQIAIFIGIDHTLLVDDGLGRSREVTPYFIETVFYLCYLIERHRCPSVTLNTALSLAGTKVTTELLRQDV